MCEEGGCHVRCTKHDVDLDRGIGFVFMFVTLQIHQSRIYMYLNHFSTYSLESGLRELIILKENLDTGERSN